MAAISIQTQDATSGVALSFGSANSGGDTFANDGKTALVVKNGGGASIDVTITSQLTSVDDQNYGHIALSDLVVAVAASAERVLPFLAPSRFNDSDGLVHVGYSSATSVTVTAVKMQAPV